MNLSISIAKFLATPSESAWGQVHDFTPEGGEKLLKRGRIVAVLSSNFSFQSQLETINVGHEILTRLHEEYFGSLDTLAFDALRQAVSKVTEEFSSDIPVQIGAFAIMDGKIIFAGINGVLGYVLRGGALSKILDSAVELTAGAGVINLGDAFLLGTKEFFFMVPEGSIKASLEKPTPSQGIEYLTSFVYENKKENAVGVILKVGGLSGEVAEGESHPALQDKQSFLSDKQSFLSDESATSKVRVFEPQGIRRVIINLIDAIVSKIPERKIKIISDLKDLEGKKSKRQAVAVGGILLILLAVSIVFGISQRNLKISRSKYEGRLIEAQQQLEEAMGLAALNQARARELLLSSRNTLSELKNEGIKDRRIDESLTKINLNIGSIAGIYEVTPEMYLDLSLLSDGFNGDDISFSEGRMIILDRQGKLVSITLNSKKTKVLAGAEKISGAKFASTYSDRNFVLKEDKVIEVLGEAKTVIEKDWERAEGMHAFAANIYILDKGKNEILRYAGSESGFGSQNNWFAPGIKVDLSGVISWAIDGSIWFLTDSGEIEKYTNGNPQSFVVKGLEGDLSGAVDIFSHDTAKYLYVLDKGGGRVVVLDKNGGFKAEYVSDQIKSSTKLIVSEDEKKIILLSGDKLYSIEAKHL